MLITYFRNKRLAKLLHEFKVLSIQVYNLETKMEENKKLLKQSQTIKSQNKDELHELQNDSSVIEYIALKQKHNELYKLYSYNILNVDNRQVVLSNMVIKQYRSSASSILELKVELDKCEKSMVDALKNGKVARYSQLVILENTAKRDIRACNALISDCEDAKKVIMPKYNKLKNEIEKLEEMLSKVKK